MKKNILKEILQGRLKDWRVYALPFVIAIGLFILGFKPYNLIIFFVIGGFLILLKLFNKFVHSGNAPNSSGRVIKLIQNYLILMISLIIFFSLLSFFISESGGGGLNYEKEYSNVIQKLGDYLYFNTMTLTTLGGNIYPVGGWMKLVIGIESILGHGLIPLLVGLAIGLYYNKSKPKH